MNRVCETRLALAMHSYSRASSHVAKQRCALSIGCRERGRIGACRVSLRGGREASARASVDITFATASVITRRVCKARNLSCASAQFCTGEELLNIQTYNLRRRKFFLPHIAPDSKISGSTCGRRRTAINEP